MKLLFLWGNAVLLVFAFHITSSHCRVSAAFGRNMGQILRSLPKASHAKHTIDKVPLQKIPQQLQNIGAGSHHVANIKPPIPAAGTNPFSQSLAKSPKLVQPAPIAQIPKPHLPVGNPVIPHFNPSNPGPGSVPFTPSLVKSPAVPQTAPLPKLPQPNVPVIHPLTPNLQPFPPGPGSVPFTPSLVKSPKIPHPAPLPKLPQPNVPVIHPLTPNLQPFPPGPGSVPITPSLAKSPKVAQPGLPQEATILTSPKVANFRSFPSGPETAALSPSLTNTLVSDSMANSHSILNRQSKTEVDSPSVNPLPSPASLTFQKSQLKSGKSKGKGKQKDQKKKDKKKEKEEVDPIEMDKDGSRKSRKVNSSKDKLWNIFSNASLIKLLFWAMWLFIISRLMDILKIVKFLVSFLLDSFKFLSKCFKKCCAKDNPPPVDDNHELHAIKSTEV